MTKKLFHSLCFVAIAVFLASVALIMGVLYGYFSRIQQTQLRMQTQLAAQGVEKSGLDYFAGLPVRDYRITWIGADGKVLYDTAVDAAAMTDHQERAEVREALASGFGQDQRLSATLTGGCSTLPSGFRTARCCASPSRKAPSSPCFWGWARGWRR